VVLKREGAGSGRAVIRQSHLMAVVGAFLVACTVLLMVVGCAGMRSEAPQKEERAHTEATTEKARCEGTRTFQSQRELFTTNDVPGCPNGGLLSGTDKADNLDGKDGDDEIRGLGGVDVINGGDGNDVIYGGPGNDSWLSGDEGVGNGDDVIYGGPGNDAEMTGGGGEDVIYGGDGNDVHLDGYDGEDVIYAGDGNDWIIGAFDRQRDKLYCGEGKDWYFADKLDYVDSSCEKKDKIIGVP
jgi:RTX calcium-binding nonapeptide repeat (4 copies)